MVTSPLLWTLKMLKLKAFYFQNPINWHKMPATNFRQHWFQITKVGEFFQIFHLKIVQYVLKTRFIQSTIIQFLSLKRNTLQNIDTRSKRPTESRRVAYLTKMLHSNSYPKISELIPPMRMYNLRSLIKRLYQQYISLRGGGSSNTRRGILKKNPKALAGHLSKPRRCYKNYEKYQFYRRKKNSRKMFQIFIKINVKITNFDQISHEYSLFQ